MKVLKFTIQDYSFEIHVILNTEVLKKENPYHIIKLICKEKNLNTFVSVPVIIDPIKLKNRINTIQTKIAMQYVDKWASKVDPETELENALTEMGFEDE